MQSIEQNAGENKAVIMRRVTFISLLILVALISVRASFIPEDQNGGPAALLAPLLLGVLVAGWCMFDGRIRRKPVAPIGLMGIVMVYPIGFPIYCLWSRGLKGIPFLVGFALLLVATVIATMAVCLVVAEDAVTW